MAGCPRGLEKAAAAGGGASQEQLSEMLEEVLDDLTKAQDKQSEAGGLKKAKPAVKKARPAVKKARPAVKKARPAVKKARPESPARMARARGKRPKARKEQPVKGTEPVLACLSGDPNQGAGSLRDRVTSSLATMGSKLSDPEMASIAKGVAQLRADGDPRLVAYLAQAAQILEEHLAAGAMQNRIELSRLPGSRPARRISQAREPVLQATERARLRAFPVDLRRRVWHHASPEL